MTTSTRRAAWVLAPESLVRMCLTCRHVRTFVKAAAIDVYACETCGQVIVVPVATATRGERG